MNDLLRRKKLEAVCDAKKRLGRAHKALEREWQEYRELQAALERERAFGHPEDIPPMVNNHERRGNANV